MQGRQGTASYAIRHGGWDVSACVRYGGPCIPGPNGVCGECGDASKRLDEREAAPIENAPPDAAGLYHDRVPREAGAVRPARSVRVSDTDSSGATEAAQQEEAFRNMLAMDPHAQGLLLGGVYRTVDAAAVAHTNAAVRAVAEKIVSIGGTQSKLGKVYLRELAALLANDSETPNGSAAQKGTAK
jgi:hypothetical protein